MMMIETLSAAVKVLSYMLILVYLSFIGFFLFVFIYDMTAEILLFSHLRELVSAS